MRVRVTWWDIWLGMRRHGRHCAVGRALQRASGDRLATASVAGIGVGGQYYAPPPLAVQRFIIDFDRCTSWWDRLKLRPFVFELSGV